MKIKGKETKGKRKERKGKKEKEVIGVRLGLYLQFDGYEWCKKMKKMRCFFVFVFFFLPFQNYIYLKNKIK